MRPRKLYILILFLLSAAAGRAQPVWEPVPSPTTHTLRNLHFVDSLYGWAAGDSGAVIATTNGGMNWFSQRSGVETDIYDIHFSDRNNGWGVTWRLDTLPYGTMLIHTTNGGAYWKKVPWDEPDIFLLTVYFSDSLNGWLGGYEGHMYRTFDGGNEWRPEGIVPGFCSFFPVLHYNFYNSQFGLAAGGHVDISGVLWRTTNNGEDWTSNCYSPEPLNAVYYLDSMNIISVGGDFEYGTGIVRSTDAGETWTYTSLEIFGIAKAIDFRKPGEAWSPLTFANKMIYSFDTCRTWNVYLFPELTDIFDLKFVDSTKGYAVGSQGCIFRYTPEATGVRNSLQYSDNGGKKINIRNYPNPFISKTTIEIYLPDDEDVSLCLYNIQGELIKTIYNGFFESGGHEINLPVESVPAGIYFIEVRTGKSSARSKILKLK